MSTSDQKPAKRKTMTNPETSPERAHKDKRPATADQQVVDYGSNRVYDPLGGPAYVPSKVKESAVSDWLDEQSNKCRLIYWILFDVVNALFVGEVHKILTQRQSCFCGLNSYTGAERSVMLGSVWLGAEPSLRSSAA